MEIGRCSRYPFGPLAGEEFAALAAGAAVAGTSNFTSDDENESSPREATSPVEGPTTYADELADIEAALATYRAVFDATNSRARECEEREQAGLETYDDCFFREVRGPTTTLRPRRRRLSRASAAGRGRVRLGRARVSRQKTRWFSSAHFTLNPATARAAPESPSRMTDHQVRVVEAMR